MKKKCGMLFGFFFVMTDAVFINNADVSAAAAMPEGLSLINVRFLRVGRPL